MSAWSCTPAPSAQSAWARVATTQDEDASAVAALEARLTAKRESVRKCQAPEPVGAAIAATIQREQEEAEEAANMALDNGEVGDDGDVHPFIVPDFVDDEEVEDQFGQVEEDGAGFDFMQ